MFELAFDANVYNKLKILQAEKYIDNSSQIRYLYDDLSIGSLNVQSIEERILSLQKLRVDYDFDYMIKNYKEILFQLKNNNSVRIWASSCAHEEIGFYMVCYIINKLNIQNITVYLCHSSEIYQDGRATILLSIPNDFLTLINKRLIVKPSKYINVAKKYIQENAPLRIKINNKIISKQIDYFDKMILSCKKKCPYISDKELCSEILYEYGNKNSALMRDDIILNRIKFLENRIYED